MSLRPTAAATAVAPLGAERNDVDAVIAAARAADRAFREQQAPTGAPQPVPRSQRPKSRTQRVTRIPLESEVEMDGGAEKWKDVYLLDLLSRLDGAHDPLCGGSSVNANVVVPASATSKKGQTVGPWHVPDCNVNGYFMTKSSILGNGCVVPDAELFAGNLRLAPSTNISVVAKYGGAFPICRLVGGKARAFSKKEVEARTGTETLTFTALKPFVDAALVEGKTQLDGLRAMCAAAGNVPEGAKYNDFETDEDGNVKVGKKGEKTPKQTRVRTTQLEDFVDNLCLDVELEGYLPGEEPIPGAAAFPQAMGEPAHVRTGRPTREAPLRTERQRRGDLSRSDSRYVKGSDEFVFHEQRTAIAASSFGAELAEFTTWAVLDTAGLFPRGAIFVRYVPLKVAYETWPKLPIFKPPDVTDDDWTRYVSILRRERVLADYELGFKQEKVPFPWSKFVNAVDAARLTHVCPFDAAGGLKTSLAFRRYVATDSRPGSEDYLYTTLVCASSREPDFEPGKGVQTNFGNALLNAADKLASHLGIGRLVLSALPPVVGYYNKVHKYSPCSRTGLNLEYATWTFGIEKNKRPDGSIASTYPSYGSRTVDIYYPHDVKKSDMCVPQDNQALRDLQREYNASVDELARQGEDTSATPTTTVADVAAYVCYPSPAFALDVVGPRVYGPEQINAGHTASTFTRQSCASLEEGWAMYQEQLTAITDEMVEETMEKIERNFADDELAFYKGEGNRRTRLQVEKASGRQRDRDWPNCFEYLTREGRVECAMKELLLDYANDLSVANNSNPPLSYADAIPYIVLREELRARVTMHQTATINAIRKERPQPYKDIGY